LCTYNRQKFYQIISVESADGREEKADSGKAGAGAKVQLQAAVHLRVHQVLLKMTNENKFLAKQFLYL
jgi:hypothetical protein